MRLLMSLALAIGAGAVLGHASASGDPAWWLLGGLLLVSSALFAVAAVRASRPLADRYLALLARRPHYLYDRRRHPRLGELLVSKHRLISQPQLEQALRRQRGSRRLLGRLLVDMGLISQDQLRDVLGDQRSGGRIWRERRRR